MTKACWIAALVLAPLSAARAGTVARTACEGSEASKSYPTFCAIPATPTHVRSPKAFRTAVVDTRIAGLKVVRDSGPETFVLSSGDTEAFDQTARGEAAYPATKGAAGADTIDFAATARRLATPPPRPRR